MRADIFAKRSTDGPMKNLLHSPHRHGILLAVCVAACSPSESSPEVGEARSDIQSGGEPGPLAPGVTPPARPGECMGLIDNQCMRYLIPLLGNPSTDVALRNKYIAAFGSACYISEANTFDCFYKTWQKACADAVKIAEVAGNQPYDKGYACQPVGNGDYTLQIGQDIALYITIKYQHAPRQTPLTEVNGVPTAVNGPYRDLTEPQKLGPGQDFYCTYITNVLQKDRLFEMNRNAHSGKVHSDLAGFTYPCQVNGTCTEPLVLKDPAQKPPPPLNDPDRAEVHHVVPRFDKRTCPWGTNSNKNAAIVSRRLNRFLTNDDPPADEVLQLNNTTSYPP